jgi:hypothetical protein
VRRLTVYVALAGGTALVVLAALGWAANRQPMLLDDPPVDVPLRLGEREPAVVFSLPPMNARAQPEKARAQVYFPAEDEEDGPVDCRTGEDILKYGPRCGVMGWSSQ